jgi:hypothetical protein
MANKSFDSNMLSVPAVKGVNTATPLGAPPECVGVAGQSDLGVAVAGHSKSGFGVHGFSQSNFGVRAVSMSGVGLRATTDSGGAAIEGTAFQSGFGIAGNSDTGHGVHGNSRTNHAVHGESAAGRGVVGVSQTFVGVTGESASSDGVFGVSVTGIGVHGKGGKLAGFFEGDVEVTGDVRLTNADCAEDFDIAEFDLAEPGSVMVLRDDGGALRMSSIPYDKRVAGVVSGAGSYKPGIVLDKQSDRPDRLPIALLGKVFVKADASFGAITVGDLLTTSESPGHAMKASDPVRAFGAVIGKALRSLGDGQGLIPILIALQ